MNTQYMKVNPNELVIDLPVDEANVQKKMDSMRLDGVVGQPIAIWLNGSRIIDGFHRTVAAQRLGWAEIDCVVTDCDEERFWDLRIQSAKQHASIEQKRLEAWIVACWNSTEWDDELIQSDIQTLCESDKGIVDFVQDELLKQKNALEKIDFLKVKSKYANYVPLWMKRVDDFCRKNEVNTWLELADISDARLRKEIPGISPYINEIRKIQASYLVKLSQKTTKLSADGYFKNKKAAAALIAAWGVYGNGASSQIREWFEDKAKKWDLTIYGICRVMFDSFAENNEEFHLFSDYFRRLGHFSRNYSLSEITVLDKADALNTEVLIQFAKQKKSGKKLGDFIAEKQERDRLSEEKEKEKNEAIRKVTEDTFHDLNKAPISQAEVRKQKLAGLDRQIDSVFKSIELLQIDGFPEVARRLTSLIDLIENRIEESFPDLAQKTKVNPIIAENIELRRQAEEQKRKIESLERALNSKQGSTKMLPKTQAFSSIEIEAMA